MVFRQRISNLEVISKWGVLSLRFMSSTRHMLDLGDYVIPLKLSAKCTHVKLTGNKDLGSHLNLCRAGVPSPRATDGYQSLA